VCVCGDGCGGFFDTARLCFERGPDRSALCTADVDGDANMAEEEDGKPVWLLAPPGGGTMVHRLAVDFSLDLATGLS
jgi:hypothetical protein